MLDQPEDFEEAFDALAAVAYRVAYRVLGDREEARDVAQETLTRAYARWSKVSAYALPWVARVAANEALGRARRRPPLMDRPDDGVGAVDPVGRLEVEIQGRWQYDQASDLGRILRVQVVLRAMGDRARALGADPVVAARLLGTFVDHVAVDRALSPGEILRIARALLQMGPGRIHMAVLPVRPATVEGSDVLVRTAGTAPFLRSFLDGTPLPTPATPVEIGTAPAPACRT